MWLRRGVLAMLLSGSLLIGVTGTTLAQDGGGCPAGQGYELMSLDALNAQYPGAGDYARRKDNNGDERVCVKTTAKPNPNKNSSVHLGFVDNNK